MSKDIHVILHLPEVEWTYINPAGKVVPSRRNKHRDLCDHLKGKGIRTAYFKEGEGFIPNRVEDQIGTVCSLPQPCPEGGEMQRVAVTQDEMLALYDAGEHVNVLWASDLLGQDEDGEYTIHLPEPTWNVQRYYPETGEYLTYTVEDEEGNVTEMPQMEVRRCNAIR